MKHNFEQMLEQAQQNFIISMPYEDLTFCSAKSAACLYHYYKQDWSQAPYWLLGHLEPIAIQDEHELKKEYLAILDGRQIWDDFLKGRKEDKIFAKKMKSVPREKRGQFIALADKFCKELDTE